MVFGARHIEYGDLSKNRRVYFAFFVLLCSMFYAPLSYGEASYAVSMYGDIKYPPNFKHFDYVNPNAPKGGKIVLPAIGTFDSLNPYILKGRPADNLDLIFDRLMEAAQDETATNYGLVAESAEVAPDNSWVIFNINPRAKFSDGSLITADDIVFSFETLLEKGHPIYKIFYGDIGKVEKLSARSVKFNIKNPKNRELKFILGQLPVLSAKYYAKHDFTKTTLEAPLGSGPYEVATVEQGRAITFKRRKDYWAENLPVNLGRHNFDEIRVEYYMDANVAVEAFKAGKLDLRYENIARNWAKSYNIPQVADGRIIKAKIPHQIPTGMQGFAFNTRRDKFADIRVRKALNAVLDFEWMNKNLFYDSYARTESFFSNSIYASRGLPSKQELEMLNSFKNILPPEIFTQEFKLAKSDGSGRNRAQLLQAKKLLEEVGWKIKNGELTNVKGKKFTIEFLLQQGGSMERLMPSIIKNLEILGIKSSIRSADTSQYKKRLDEFDFDIVVTVWGQSNSPGNEQISYWHSSTADTKGSRNLVGIKNPAVDFLVEKIVNAQNKNELVTAAHALDRVLLWNYYVIPQFYAGYFRILYWNKFERPQIMPKYDNEFGLSTWWVKPLAK